MSTVMRSGSGIPFPKDKGTTLSNANVLDLTTMVANEGLEKAEPMDPGPPGPTALHPL